MARKKRTGPPGKQHGRPVQAKPCPLHEQIQSGRSLSEFVKLEFERGGATFNQEGLSSELLQLLQDVKLVERPGTQHNPGRAPLGLCQQTLPQLLAHVRRRFNLRLAEDVLSTVQWQQLHSILGDRCLCNMFYTYQVFLCVGGSRWLQLTGYWKATNPTEGVGVVKSKPWTPSEIIIKRHILHVAKFTARAGLPHSSPLRKIILKEGADEAGAKRFIWWILSPKFHHLDVPPPLDASVAPLPQRAKRQRGKRKHKGQQPPNEDQERAAKHTKIAPAEKHVPSLQREVLFEALMEPVLHMLKKTPSVNFQELLSKHSPSHRALLILKVFEQKNQRLGDHALPSICGLRCSCHSRRPKAKVSKETRARSGNLFQCTGGPAEIRFMRDFPALSCAASGQQVARFLCAALKELLDLELVGKKNWVKLVEFLKLLVYQRRLEELSVHDIMQGLSVKEFQDGMIRRFLTRKGDPFATKAPKLGQLQDSRVMAEVLGRVCYFIFVHLAVPLLRGHFYATEAEPGGMKTIYFRKNVWHFLRSRADCGFLHLCMDKDADPNEARSSGATGSQKKSQPSRRFNAPPVVRWVPKKRGFRPIVKIAKWADQGKLGAKQKAVLPILANLRASNPGILGHSLMNQNEVHGHLLEAMARLKAHYGPNIQDLYVVVADLRNCYDRILHQPLLGRIDQLPLQKRYKIVPMSLQRGTGRPQYLDLALHRAGGNAVAELLRSLTTCPAPLRREPLVLMPGRSVQTEVTCSEVTKILKSAVQGCAVLLASQPRTVELPNYAAPIPVGCRLLSGIPQGSRFSPFLCALHMGAGDGRLPADVAESLGSGRSALARLVDDFLYLSTDPRSCCNFLSCLAQEENPYQGDLNWQKCAGNFPFRSLESSQDPCFVPASSQRLPPSSTEVPWAGLTLAPANGFLNIRQGTKRRVTDAMAVRKPKRGKLGKVKVWEQVIRSKLLNFLKLKLQPLLLDPRLNSPDCVRDNLLRVCRGCAWRFLWLLHSRRLPTVTPVFVRRQTQRLVRYATRRADTVREGLASNDQLNIKGIVRSAFRGALRPRQNRPLLKEASESLKPRLKGARRSRKR